MKIEDRTADVYRSVTLKTIDPVVLSIIVGIILTVIGQCLAKRTKAEVFHFLRERPILVKIMILKHTIPLGSDMEDPVRRTLEQLAADVTMEDLQQIEKDLEYVSP